MGTVLGVAICVVLAADIVATHWRLCGRSFTWVFVASLVPVLILVVLAGLAGNG